jgi:hypothetical protein
LKLILNFIELNEKEELNEEDIFEFQKSLIVGLLVGGIGQRRQIITSMEVGVIKMLC